jgi:hypothetical protein
MLMLDLCSGAGGAGQAMLERAWNVITVDIEPAFAPVICADVRNWQYSGPRPDLIWWSAPCLEFSRESMPWARRDTMPDMSIALACWRIVETAQPRFYCGENVRGAVPWFRPYFGSPRQHIGPFYLWHNLPLLRVDMRNYRKKESYSSTQTAERAKVPYELSLAVALMVEQQGTLFDVA